MTSELCVEIQGVWSQGSEIQEIIFQMLQVLFLPWLRKNITNDTSLLFPFVDRKKKKNLEVIHSQLISYQSLLLEKSNPALHFHWLRKLCLEQSGWNWDSPSLLVSRLSNLLVISSKIIIEVLKRLIHTYS